ncbi:two-component sensor histidine kinase [Rhodococcus sp. SRB_17]|uniref:sensor histidine kinase n=1 Tax=Rhodococcus sp. OK302 TaxID=1882769 RepID=UPI000B93D002|nr:sensor histidine kinase [Rhodococcus sp. OK302]NMM84148.1 two-component sensor histidine kinase [Rhodococcus sp. SRB_17]OYD69158.1 signal transduction histidine kinase [Rhodococcus sp. OK302]
MARFPTSERFVRWSADHARGIDIGIAVLVTLISSVVAVENGPLAIPITLGMTVPLAWRRSKPELSGMTVAAFAVLHVIFIGNALLGSAIAVPISLYALAAYGARWSSLTGLGLALLGAIAAAIRYFRYQDIALSALLFQCAAVMVFVLAVWAFGDLRRVRTKQLEGLTERAHLLELERAQEAEIATISERSRIAREMHDIVAHSLTVVIAQADGGRYSAAQDPQAAVQALETIAATGRQALTDMRALLSVLREDSPRDFAVIPGVGDIDTLLGELTRSGLDVDVTVTGEPRELSAGAGLTAYRIMQESLTNVLKHAGPGAHAAVEMTWTETELVLGITDDGRGGSAALVESSPGGQGLIGMAERARLHGGTVTAGPRPGGGYSVRGVLPYRTD